MRSFLPRRRYTALALIVVSASPHSAFAQQMQDEVLVVPPSGDIEVDWGDQRLTFTLSANGSSSPILSAQTAAALELKAGFIGVRFNSGTNRIAGKSAVSRYRINGRAMKRRVVWFPLDVAPGRAGLLGPGAVPFPIVRFELHPQEAGEQEYIMPLSRISRDGMGTDVNGVTVLFAPHSPTSQATASAGAALAADYNGKFVGAPFTQPIHFGIIRPVRSLELAAPFIAGPVSLSALSVRTTDFGNTSGIPEKSADPNEIVVAAKAKGNTVANSWINIGTDALSHCSSITFNTITKTISLHCLPAGRK